MSDDGPYEHYSAQELSDLKRELDQSIREQERLANTRAVFRTNAEWELSDEKVAHDRYVRLTAERSRIDDELANRRDRRRRRSEQRSAGAPARYETQRTRASTADDERLAEQSTWFAQREVSLRIVEQYLETVRQQNPDRAAALVHDNVRCHSLEAVDFDGKSSLLTAVAAAEWMNVDVAVTFMLADREYVCVQFVQTADFRATGDQRRTIGTTIFEVRDELITQVWRTH